MLPFVSLVILTYNQKRFIKETLEGALSQDYQHLEIIISDDGSKDGTFEEIERLTAQYSGIHKLIVCQNQPNKGLVKHVNHVLMNLVHGDYVMLSGGDDRCFPQTVSTAISCLIENELNSIACNMIKIDGESKDLGLFHNTRTSGAESYTLQDYIVGNYKTSGACRLFKLEIFKTFGPLMPDCPTEDSPNLLRTFLYGGVGYCFVPSIEYRVHPGNISGLVSLMTKINPQKIFVQYMHDLETALLKGMISKSDYDLVGMKLRRDLGRQIAVRYIFNKRKFTLRLFAALSYAFNGDFSLRDVKGLCLQVIGWHRCGI